MLKKLKTLLILILMAAIAYLLFQGSTFLDNKLENKSKPWVQEEPIIAPVTKTNEEIQSKTVIEEAKAYAKEKDAELSRVVDAMPITLDSESDEVSNINYDWLKRQLDCYPSAKADIREAFNNDGIVRENEYYEILGNCNAWNNAQDVGAKSELRNMVQ